MGLKKKKSAQAPPETLQPPAQIRGVIGFIINHHKLIEVLFVAVLIVSVLCIPLIRINYDLTEYLPADAPAKQAITKMEEEFGYPGTGRLMLENVSIYEAKEYKDRIEAVEGVDTVLWCDTNTDIFQSESFIDYDKITDFYKDQCAVMNVTFVYGDTDPKTSKAIDKILEIIDGRGYLVGTAIQDKSLQENLKREIMIISAIAVVMIFLILCVATTSWFEPVLFLLIMGISILINKGTNLIFGEISFLTNSVSSILQLAIAMDYSIFLLHTFTRERGKGFDTKQALANAIREAVSSILSSGATTIVGFIVLALMRFSIGFDLGLVLAKGIVIALLTVLFLMPSLILRFEPLIKKTAHRPFLPSFRHLSKGLYHIRIGVLVLGCIVALPAFVGQNMNSFLFGNDAVGAGEGTEINEHQKIINQKFGRSNMLMVIVPNTSYLTEKALSDQLENLDYTVSILSLPSQLPEGMPESMVPPETLSKVHTDDYARMMVYIKTKNESDLAFQCADEIKAIVKSYYPEDSYVAGVTPSNQDIERIITADYNVVNILSMVGVAVVILITFRSVLVPILVLIPIELAIFLNMVFPYLMGESMIYLGYIIVSCLQLGATVDYSILLTNNYMEMREKFPKKQAAIQAIQKSTPSVLTSGMILTVVGYIMFFTSNTQAIGDMGHLIGRGALFSMVLVLTLLPALLTLCDRPILWNRRRLKRKKWAFRLHYKKLWASTPEQRKTAKERRRRLKRGKKHPPAGKQKHLPVPKEGKELVSK